MQFPALRGKIPTLMWLFEALFICGVVMDFLAKNICHKPHDMLVIRYSAFSMELSKKVGNFYGDFAGKFLLWQAERERRNFTFLFRNFVVILIYSCSMHLLKPFSLFVC